MRSFIATGQRSFADYLLRPVLASMEMAFRQRSARASAAVPLLGVVQELEEGLRSDYQRHPAHGHCQENLA
ncbi:hypothetical protein [Acidimangrovimonas pyrenivorans]|uniref:Uncharacterized protein n=1 Tax=Acidimangrovimonas pyrenivorans TaxID=2030798 RepID=A0ABV7AIW5_9RHOB